MFDTEPLHKHVLAGARGAACAGFTQQPGGTCVVHAWTASTVGVALAAEAVTEAGGVVALRRRLAAARAVHGARRARDGRARAALARETFVALVTATGAALLPVRARPAHVSVAQQLFLAGAVHAAQALLLAPRAQAASARDALTTVAARVAAALTAQLGGGARSVAGAGVEAGSSAVTARRERRRCDQETDARDGGPD